MIPIWSTAEVTLESARDYANPYLDAEVEATFDGPDGARIRRPAFWDGGRTWRVRFAPTAPGAWSWRTTSANPDDSGLHKATGTIVAIDASPSAPVIGRHGFLRPSDDGTHMAHADGTPFFWLGDTHWRFAWERWDAANKPGWTSQFRGMVDRRVAQGFSVYQTNIMSFGRGWDVAGCWENGAPYQRLLPCFFSETLDPRMAYIADRGLVNALGIGWYQAVDVDPEGLARFARYLVARYGSLPIVWTLGGEVAGYDASLREARLAGWRNVARAIGATDDYRHPVTAHLTNERPIADYYQDEAWLSLTLNQLGHGDLDMNPKAYIDHLRAHPARPIVEGESMYEGITTMEPVQTRTATDTIVRQVAYRAFQSGCCGYTYGAQGCWNNAWDDASGDRIWGMLPWYDGIDLPGAEQLGHLRRFYESLAWWTLHPDLETFTTTSGENELFYPPNVSSNNRRETVVVYFGEAHRAGGDEHLTGLTADTYSIEWFDPRNGTWSSAIAISTVDGRLLLPGQPDAVKDWILVARAA